MQLSSKLSSIKLSRSLQVRVQCVGFSQLIVQRTHNYTTLRSENMLIGFDERRPLVANTIDDSRTNGWPF